MSSRAKKTAAAGEGRDKGAIKVLVVDDSLFMRKLISDMLNSVPGIEVLAAAKDGAEAVKQTAKTRPDCITLDLVMPGWHGLTTLRHIMRRFPTPVVIVSAHSREGADITMACLQAGAIGFVLKPSGERSLDIERVRDQLIREVRTAAKAKVGAPRRVTARRKRRRAGPRPAGPNRIVVVGASTGGPQALEALLPGIPADFSHPILVLQHMPSLCFTESLAEHLNRNCHLEVKVAEPKEAIRPGKVYLAPGGFHLTLSLDSVSRSAEPGASSAYRVALSEDKTGGLSPSIDRAMTSVARLCGRETVGVILSGMGRDGLEGAQAIKEAGGKTIVEDESALIFGMPKAVIDAGYADAVLPATELSQALLETMGREEETVESATRA